MGKLGEQQFIKGQAACGLQMCFAWLMSWLHTLKNREISQVTLDLWLLLENLEDLAT